MSLLLLSLGFPVKVSVIEEIIEGAVATVNEQR